MAYSLFGTTYQSQNVQQSEQLKALRATITDKLGKAGGRLHGHLHVQTKDNINIARIGNDKDDHRILFHQELNMCNKHITHLNNPINPHDAVTKGYVDRSIKPQKCHVFMHLQLTQMRRGL